MKKGFLGSWRLEGNWGGSWGRLGWLENRLGGRPQDSRGLGTRVSPGYEAGGERCLGYTWKNCGKVFEQSLKPEFIWKFIADSDLLNVSFV